MKMFFENGADLYPFPSYEQALRAVQSLMNRSRDDNEVAVILAYLVRTTGMILADAKKRP